MPSSNSSACALRCRYCKAAGQVGFADQSHFTRVFKQQTGVTPKIYQAAFS
jgi:AraC-like DNA-binding protein